MSEAEAIATHESAHAVVAAAVGLKIAHISIDPADPHVKTRYRIERSPVEQIVVLTHLALTDLAGAVVENEVEPRIADERNALERCIEIVALRHGVEKGKHTASMHAEAYDLRQRLRSQARALVDANLRAIERLAAALADGKVLDQDAVDALVANAR
jgi:hypothetical protein